jgi:hypothetical protein
LQASLRLVDDLVFYGGVTIEMLGKAQKSAKRLSQKKDSLVGLLQELFVSAPQSMQGTVRPQQH